MKYVALLRGINVGGKNVIGMSALRTCFEAEGLRDVVTYIQSGNVIFTGSAGRAALVRRIEKALATRFAYRARVVLRSRNQLRTVVERAPRGFGAHPTKYRYDVAFLKEPLTAASALKRVVTRPGVDEAHAGTGVLYFSRLTRKASQSKLSKIAADPIYQHMTVRNWNTTTKLLAMMEETQPASRGS